MPYTVSVSFDRFYENINLSGNHRDVANRRKDDIISSLKNNFNILEGFASGSIPRYTALKGNADLDVIIALHYTNHIKGKKPSEVLQTVRDALKYRTNVRKNGQAVTLYYKTWPNVDIVPCSRVVDDGGNVTSYSIPDMNTEEWITSKPKRHTSNMTKRAGVCGANFRRVITMIKHWNSYHSSYLQSYHIEALSLKIFTSTMDDITWDIVYFFEKAIELTENSMFYEGAYVDTYLTWSNRYELKKRLETAKNKAVSAWYMTYDANDDDEGAIKIWRQLFGDKFPKHG